MRILALAPHTDDIEFGCGASIARWVMEGAKVYGISFSCGTANSKEFKNASKILGLKEATVLQFETRLFQKARQLILNQMVFLERRIKPHIVLIPSTSDTHQDHQVIRDEGFRAFKRTSLIGYEMPQNNLTFQTNMLVKVEEKHIQKKLDSLDCYYSQKERPYITEEFIRSLARVRGLQAGCEYAEAFEVMRWIV